MSSPVPTTNKKRKGLDSEASPTEAAVDKDKRILELEKRVRELEALNEKLKAAEANAEEDEDLSDDEVDALDSNDAWVGKYLELRQL
jgi:hypothetical protein